MKSEAQTLTPAAPRTTLGAILRRDRLAQGIVGGFFAVAVVFLAPWLDADQRALLSSSYVYPAFVLLATIALATGIDQLPRTEERQFWRDLLAAHLFWLASYVFHPWLESKVARALLDDTCYALFYLAMVLAVERRVHLKLDWRPTAFERLLAWPGVMVFVSGLLAYFVMVPQLFNPSAYRSHIPSLYLFLSLDLYLTLTFAYLARSARSRRWRNLYFLLTLAMGGILLGDFLERLRYGRWGWDWGTPFDFLWCLPLVLMALAARARHLRYPARELAESSRPEGNLSGPAGRTMVMALAFPLIHFLGYGTLFLDPVTQSVREILVFAVLLLLGAIAFGQQQLLTRRVRQVLSEREAFEDALRNSEQDLRILVERQHALQRLELVDRKFFEAFRTSPDIMAISSLRDGRLIEINHSFETLLGYGRGEALGRTVEDLGLWAHPDDRRAMTEQLRREGRVRSSELGFQKADGETGVALFSAEPITIDEEECMLSVTHDVSEMRHLEHRLAEESQRLDELPTAVLVLDHGGTIVAANRRAQELSGHRGDDLLGRSLRQILAGGTHPPDPGPETWHGQLELITAEGDPLPVVARQASEGTLPDTGSEARASTILVMTPAPS